MGRSYVHKQSRSRGITIVEILVILACLAILAGILLPILAHVREAGFRTKCAANMQQLANAFQTYAQDWSDYWPCPGGLKGDYAYWHQSGQGGLTRYVKQKGYHSIWCCPKMPEWGSYYPPRTYCMNSYLREPEDCEYPTCTLIKKGIRTSNIRAMNSTVLLFEGVPLTVGWEENSYYVYIYRCCNWSRVKGFYPNILHTIDPGRPWHLRANNYVYCDGHLATRPPGRKTAGELSTYKEMREWYVDKTKFEQRWAAGKYPGAPKE